MFTEGCPICGATELPHEDGCMYKSCYSIGGVALKDPLVGDTITQLTETVNRIVAAE